MNEFINQSGDSINKDGLVAWIARANVIVKFRFLYMANLQCF
jgi:chitinase